MLEPYIHPEGHEATPLLPINLEMFDAIAAAHERNVDLHLHAIGDGAVRSALDAIERARKHTTQRVIPERQFAILKSSARSMLSVLLSWVPAQTTPTSVLLRHAGTAVSGGRALQSNVPAGIHSAAWWQSHAGQRLPGELDR